MKQILKFPYTKIAKTAPFRPILPITVINEHDQNKSMVFPCILDTGADFCLLPEAVCGFLGHKLADGLCKSEMTGIGGIEKGYLHSNLIVVANKTIKCDFFICENWTAQIGLLGHKGFFDKFQVFFDTPRKYFVLFQ